jgi:hypothetical protein
MTGESVTPSKVVVINSRSSAEPTTKIASGYQSSSSSIAITELGSSTTSAPSSGRAIRSTVTPSEVTSATTAASGSTMQTATSS